MRDRILLSEVRASPRRQLAAFVVAMIVLTGFIATVPLAKLPLARFPVVVPIQNTVTFLNDALTAAFLFGQYAVSRVRALCILAFGFLFTALMAIPHMLSFPGAFSPTGVLGGGSQETAWLYVAWHAVLPFAIIAYSWHGTDDDLEKATPLFVVIGVTTAAALCSAVAITWMIAWEPDWLFTINDRGRLLPASKMVVAVLLSLPATALLVLLLRNRSSVLDIWLMVVMFTWLCTISLVSLVSSTRFDVGWYAGRVFQSLTSVFVLVVFVSEMIRLYIRKDRAMATERRAQARQISEMEAVLIHLSRANEQTNRSALTLIHQIGQPIAAISLLAQANLKISPETADQVKDSLALLAEESEAVKQILEETRGFFKGREPERGVHDLIEVIDSAVRLVAAGEEANVTITKRYHTAVLLHHVSRIQIKQVLFNLVRNAIEALVNVNHPTISIETDATSDGTTIVSIADNGPGISPIVKARLFRPFVSTKDEGLGIGLSICQLIVQAHGGSLQVKDNPGGGSIFYFTLPPASTVTSGLGSKAQALQRSA